MSHAAGPPWAAEGRLNHEQAHKQGGWRWLHAWLGHIVFMSKSAALKEPAEERRRFIRDAGNLVRCLTIEFEIELGLGSTVVPVGKKVPQASHGRAAQHRAPVVSEPSHSVWGKQALLYLKQDRLQHAK